MKFKVMIENYDGSNNLFYYNINESLYIAYHDGVDVVYQAKWGFASL